MAVETAAIGAGWYRDPGGTAALRWWDGTQWTDHLHQPDPAPVPTAQPLQPMQAMQPVQPVQPMQPAQVQHPMQAAPAQHPDVNLSSYSPTTGFSGNPRNQSLVPGHFRDDYGNSHYGTAQQSVAPMSIPPSNGVAWAALGLGAFSLGAMIFRESFPSGNYYLPIFGISSIIMSIRAFWRYRQRRVTVLWAPILGIIFGVIAEIWLLTSLALGVINLQNQPADMTIGPSGAATAYDMGTTRPQYLPANNPGLTADADTTMSIVSMLHTAYPTGAYPTALYLDGTQIKASDGTVVGSLSLPTFQMIYTLRSDGSFLLVVGAPGTKEATMYSSKLDQYLALCEPTDNTCTTSSPNAPISISGASSSGSSTT